jgi:transcriptional regulator with XRE-family HTH domain
MRCAGAPRPIWEDERVADTLGKRIATYRRRRGLSQAALAGLIGRSESWLSQVERGIRSVDRLSVLLDLARVLHVDVEALTGRPWQYAPNGSAVAGGLTDVRKALTSFKSLLGQEPPAVVSLPELRAQVADTHRAYQAARYDEALAMVPSVLAAVEGFPGRRNGQRREALLAYTSAYVVAAKLVTKLGAGELAILAADRAANAAVDAASRTARGMAAYQVACAMLRSDQTDDAERLAVTMAEELTRHVRSDDPSLVSVAGALWLIAAVAAGRKTERDQAWWRLDQADQLAGLLGQDANFAWTAFGPTNVAIHRVAVAAELGDAGEALQAAVAVHVDSMPAGLLSRRAQVNLDLAWAQSQRKRDAEATLYLLEAERIAPQVMRHNVIAQEIIREMLTRGAKRRTTALTSLAQRSGLLQ